ncbi:MAG: GIY-YIG nuclease family protein [Candidatus Nealsonbacteria bacterium]
MYYVYVIKSKIKNWIYIGFTLDLRKRFQEHNLGKVRSTKSNRPFVFVYYEAYKNELDARKREIELKNNGQQKEFLKDRIKNSLKIVSSQPTAGQP